MQMERCLPNPGFGISWQFLTGGSTAGLLQRVTGGDFKWKIPALDNTELVVEYSSLPSDLFYFKINLKSKAWKPNPSAGNASDPSGLALLSLPRTWKKHLVLFCCHPKR